MPIESKIAKFKYLGSCYIVMFGFFLRKRVKKLEEETVKSFSAVKKDIDHVGKWLKHLDTKDKHLFELIHGIKDELSTIKEEIGEIRESMHAEADKEKHKQVFKKLPVLDKQTGVGGVQTAVQTAVQTGNFYEILKGLTSNERLLVLTLANSDMKLSYEDIAMLLGKERATIRGQINSIKQKSGGLIYEIVEKNGKKRVFVEPEIREKLAKYAKVRAGRGGK